MPIVTAVVLAISVSAGADSKSCHIHPPGALREQDPEPQFYPTIQECERANLNLYRGAGRCHCFPDGNMNRDGVDDWRFRQWHLETPPDRLP
jgi:hypothetical protein